MAYMNALRIYDDKWMVVCGSVFVFVGDRKMSRNGPVESVLVLWKN